MADSIQVGSRVTLHYTLTLADGTRVDETRPGKPATFTLGKGELFEILENHLLGLHVGERRHFEISPEESQQPLGTEVIQELARNDFPAELNLESGQIIGFQTPMGQEVPGRIVSISGAQVTVDFSHPLAGRGLIFDVEILAVESV